MLLLYLYNNSYRTPPPFVGMDALGTVLGKAACTFVPLWNKIPMFSLLCAIDMAYNELV